MPSGSPAPGSAARPGRAATATPSPRTATIGPHQLIEFGNRTLTFVLVAIAVATFVAARQSGRRDLLRLSVVLALAIPAQAVLGGISVLTDLNPWVVSVHLLLSLAIISVAVLFLHRLDHPPVPTGARAWCPRSPGRRTA